MDEVFAIAVLATFSVILIVLYVFTTLILKFLMRLNVNFCSFFTSTSIALFLSPFIMFVFSMGFGASVGLSGGLLIVVLLAVFVVLMYVFEPYDLDALINNKILKAEKLKLNEYLKNMNGKIKLLKNKTLKTEAEEEENKLDIIECKKIILIKKQEYKDKKKELKRKIFGRSEKKAEA